MRHVTIFVSLLTVTAAYLTACGDDDCTKTLTCEKSTSADGGAGAAGGGNPDGGMGVGATGGGSSLLADGDACADGSECESGICTDDVCCATACDGGCDSCALAGSEGVCTPHPLGEDPEAVCGAASTCNGDGACGGDHIWSLSFGDDEDDVVHDVAIDSQGNIIVCGSFRGTMQLGSETLTANGSNAFVAKLDSNGSVLWAKEWGDSGSERCRAIAVGPNDTLTLTGSFSSTIDLGPVPLTNGNVFVARFDASGNHQWSVDFDGANGVESVAVDSTGAAYVLGYFIGSVDLGNGSFSDLGDFDFFLVKLQSNNGAYVWHKHIGDNTYQTSEEGDVVVDADDNVIIVGSHLGSLNFGGGAIGGRGVFVAKYTASGMHLFSERFGLDLHYAKSVAVDAQGNIYVGGRSNAGLSFGGPTLGLGVYVAKLTPSLSHVWSREFGGQTQSSPTGQASAIALAPDGGVVAVGRFADTLTVGAEQYEPAGGWDVFMFRLDPSGEPLWSAAFGDNSEQWGRAVASSDAMIIAGGHFAGAIDFGGGPVTQHGAEDGFVSVHAP